MTKVRLPTRTTSPTHGMVFRMRKALHRIAQTPTRRRRTLLRTMGLARFKGWANVGLVERSPGGGKRRGAFEHGGFNRGGPKMFGSVGRDTCDLRKFVGRFLA